MTPALITDSHGNAYAPVDIEELNEWAWLIALVEDWLLHAGDDTISDYLEFTGKREPRLDYITHTLGQMVTRMQNLAEGRP